MRFGNLRKHLDAIRKWLADEWFWLGDVAVIIFIFIVAIIGAIAFVCSYRDQRKQEIESGYGNIGLIEVSARGERHEYLRIERGAVHLPNCKFCAKKGGAE